MRADRLVSILLSLQVYGSLSTRQLAERLEVSERTIHRDMDALSAVGVPVYANRGRNGGWALPEEYRGRVRWLSTDEVSALAVRNPPTMLDDLGLTGEADAAWLKLVSSLPPLHREEARRISDRIHIDLQSWKPRQEAMPWLAPLKQAVLQDRKIRIRYRTIHNTSLESTGTPLGLVARGTTWYAVLDTGEDIRTIRVSRVDDLELLEVTGERPAGFHLAAWWAESSRRRAEGLPRYPVTFDVRSDALETLRSELRWARIEHIDPPGANGWQRVSVMFELMPYALATALALGERLIVIEPAELLEATRNTLAQALAHYT
jgi:predicted DNA-binding transcriptional regulator YafY